VRSREERAAINACDMIEEALNSLGRTRAAESWLCLEEIAAGNLDIMFGEGWEETLKWVIH